MKILLIIFALLVAPPVGTKNEVLKQDDWDVALHIRKTFEKDINVLTVHGKVKSSGKIVLTKAVPQGINPKILILYLEYSPSTDKSLKWNEVKYVVTTKRVYEKVVILYPNNFSRKVVDVKVSVK